jgi:hypothetical protein
LLLDSHAIHGDEYARKQRYQKQKRGKARSRIYPVHETVPSSKKQEGPAESEPSLSSRMRLPAYRVWATLVSQTLFGAAHIRRE